MPSEKAVKIYSFFLFMLFLTSMRLWISWGAKTFVFSLFALCLVACNVFYGIKWDFCKKNVLFCSLFYSAYIVVTLHGKFSVFFTQIPSYLIPIIAITCINDQIKAKALSHITKWYAYLMIPAMVLYIASIFISIPSLGLFTPDGPDTIRGYGYFQNSFFYVRPLEIHGDFARFNGPFVEPGHLGMICAFLLFANLFNFKNKNNIIILIALFLSLSLAGYILAIIGFFLTKYYQGKLKLNRLVLYLIMLFGFVQFGQLYNDRNNIVYEKILSRLEADEERGIAGNNRTSLIVAELANKALKDPKLLLFGYSADYLGTYDEYIMGNGIQLALVRHGLLKILWTLSIYFAIFYYSKDKKYAWLFLSLLITCYLQRTYPFWFSWVICFYYAICTREQQNDKTKSV